MEDRSEIGERNARNKIIIKKSIQMFAIEQITDVNQIQLQPIQFWDRQMTWMIF